MVNLMGTIQLVGPNGVLGVLVSMTQVAVVAPLSTSTPGRMIDDDDDGARHVKR